VPRLQSRAAAIRELLKRRLAAEGFEASPFGAKSEDYGVTGVARADRGIRLLGEDAALPKIK
jgi:hypothetical protein